jgi:hypothetical protein
MNFGGPSSRQVALPPRHERPETLLASGDLFVLDTSVIEFKRKDQMGFYAIRRKEVG